MYFLSRDRKDIGYSSFEEEISRRAAIGDTQSYLYIVPTGAQARELINWVTELCSPRAITLPNILSLDEIVTTGKEHKTRGVQGGVQMREDRKVISHFLLLFRVVRRFHLGHQTIDIRRHRPASGVRQGWRALQRGRAGGC